MLEDLLFELFPVVGFAALASSIFTVVVMKSSKKAFRFVQFIAVTDISLGSTMIIGGFHCVITTIYGSSGETVKPIAVHVVLELLLDSLHSVILLLFGADRLLQMLLPVQYIKISKLYTNWPFFLLVVFGSSASLIPSLQYSIQNRGNASLLISPLCRLEEVLGEDSYSNHLWAVQWAPLVGLSEIGASLIIFGIRSTKQRWTYNWSENSSDTVQLTTVCIIRCLMAAIAVHLPLAVIASYPPESDISILTDQIIRMTFSISLPILQPIYYLISMPIFGRNIRMLFNKYSHNTKRTWQSAADPPKNGEHMDPHGDRNPFGSWYSLAGNVVGEAGLPTEERAGIERSVSFYYREEVPTLPHKQDSKNTLTVEKATQQFKKY